MRCVWRNRNHLPYSCKITSTVKKVDPSTSRKILKRSNIITVDNLYEYGIRSFYAISQLARKKISAKSSNHNSESRQTWKKTKKKKKKKKRKT